MSKHTDGPWTTGDSDLPVSTLSIHGGTRKHSTIARLVSADYVGMPPSEALANMRLIAAAPELLEALQAIVDCCNEDHADRDYASRQTEVRGIARYAIAKATGA